MCTTWYVGYERVGFGGVLHRTATTETEGIRTRHGDMALASMTINPAVATTAPPVVVCASERAD